MAAPTYNTDLNLIDDAEDATSWAESSDPGWDDSVGGPVDESDYYIYEGTQCISCTVTKTGVASMIADYGTGITFATGDCVFIWQYFAAPNALNTFAGGGQRVIIGSSLADFYAWKSGGVNYSPNPYGGWKNVAVDPTETADYTVGTPSSTKRYFGGAISNPLISIAKGNPFGLDIIRYGRGELYVEFGSVGDGYANFAGMATANDAVNARWGLFQAIAGGYLWKGLMSLGTSSNAVHFVDTGKNIVIDDTPKVSSSFNAIEINNSSSIVSLINVTIQALGTKSKGTLTVIDNADVYINSCRFVNMGNFIFQANSEVLNTIFHNCGIITAGGADFSGTSIRVYAGTANTSPFIWNVAVDPQNYTDGMNFVKGATATHAIEFGTSSPLTIHLDNMYFSGYNASHGQNDSTFHIKRTSGTVTIYCSGCSGNISYKSEGATVYIIPDPILVTVHAIDIDGNDIQNARVFLKASNDSGPFPFEESVTIVNSGTTATVTHTSHGMATGDYVSIDLSSSGCEKSHWQNDGVFQITYINDNSYSYILPSDPGSSPTGTITSTFVALTGLTDIYGDKSTNRVYSLNQPVVGWIRKTPAYKTANLFGTISSSDGFEATGVLISDD